MVGQSVTTSLKELAEMFNDEDQPNSSNGSLSILWRSRRSAPNPRAQGHAVVVNNMVYVAGGFSSNDRGNLKTIDVYFPSHNLWNSMITPHELFAMTVHMNKLLVVGGIVDQEVTDKVLVLDNNQWKDYTEMPTARCMHAAVSHESFMIVTGGQVGFTILNTTELLDGTTGQWSKCDDLPMPLSLPQSTIVDDMVYIAGGFTFSVNQDAPRVVYRTPVQTLSSHNVKWQKLANTPKSMSAVVGLKNKCLFALGGGHINIAPEMKFFGDMFNFNPSSSLWVSTAKLPIDAAAPIVIEFSECVLIMIGGVVKVAGKDDVTDKVWIGRFM